MKPYISYGWGPDGPVEDDLGGSRRHRAVFGTTGAGKSGWLISLALSLLRHPDSRVIVCDGKGELADELQNFLGVLAHDGHPIVRPEEVLVVAPFKRAAVPTNVLSPDPALDPSTQAILATRSVMAISDGFGIRMEATFAALAEAIIRLGHGSLADVRRCLADASYAAAIGRQISARPELLAYLETGLDSESPQTVAALLARLDYLLAFPPLRASLCAEGCVGPEDLFSHRLGILDAGGAPRGALDLGRFVGSIYWNLLCGGIFSRSEKSPAYVIIDEVQEVIAGEGDDLERIFALARSKHVGITIACQLQAQLSAHSPKLLASVAKNAHRRLYFRPDTSDLAEISSYLHNPVGRTDPLVPDRRLSSAEERARLLGEWFNLPDRHFVHVNRDTGKVERVRTLSLPYERVHAKAAAAADMIARFQRGRLGRPWQELRPAAPAFPASSPSENRPPDVPVQRQKRTKLVLP